MRIYKNETAVELSMDDFLELLEEDALEDIINLVLDLEMADSFDEEEGVESGSILYMNSNYVLDGTDATDAEAVAKFLQELDELEPMEYDPYEYQDDVLASLLLGMNFASEKSEPEDLLSLSKEDLKVRRISDRLSSYR